MTLSSTVNCSGPSYKLYDARQDTICMTDILNNNPETLEKLKIRLDYWLKSTK